MPSGEELVVEVAVHVADHRVDRRLEEVPDERKRDLAVLPSDRQQRCYLRRQQLVELRVVEHRTNGAHQPDDRDTVWYRVPTRDRARPAERHAEHTEAVEAQRIGHRFNVARPIEERPAR